MVDLRLEGEELAALVRFVDYGTEQWCAAGHELRKELFATEVPVQVGSPCPCPHPCRPWR